MDTFFIVVAAIFAFILGVALAGDTRNQQIARCQNLNLTLTDCIKVNGWDQ